MAAIFSVDTGNRIEIQALECSGFSNLFFVGEKLFIPKAKMRGGAILDESAYGGSVQDNYPCRN